MGNFGLAILNPDGSTLTWRVGCADEAIKVISGYLSTGHLSTRPKGVGVDAPLWWSSGPSGDRLADQWLRKTFRLSGGEVQAANSLRGAALVQGAMFVQRVRELFSEVPVTETHPKAVLKALGLDEKSFRQRFSITFEGKSPHERDAVISAVAAREGFSGRWKKDLASVRHPSEQDTQHFWLAPIHYYWPEA
jgi:predicted nuclease with RNAse H fold